MDYDNGRNQSQLLHTEGGVGQNSNEHVLTSQKPGTDRYVKKKFPGRSGDLEIILYSREDPLEIEIITGLNGNYIVET